MRISLNVEPAPIAAASQITLIFKNLCSPSSRTYGLAESARDYLGIYLTH